MSCLRIELIRIPSNPNDLFFSSSDFSEEQQQIMSISMVCAFERDRDSKQVLFKYISRNSEGWHERTKSGGGHRRNRRIGRSDLPKTVYGRLSCVAHVFSGI